MPQDGRSRAAEGEILVPLSVQVAKERLAILLLTMSKLLPRPGERLTRKIGVDPTGPLGLRGRGEGR